MVQVAMRRQPLFLRLHLPVGVGLRTWSHRAKARPALQPFPHYRTRPG
jgi:hypothetical protein